QMPEFPRSDFSRVPYAVFIEPEIYQAEQERLFKGPLWCYLALEAELPNPGDFKTTFVGDTPVVVTRGKEGGLAAFVNRCAHRGAIVRREAFGNATEHRCVYHQWCYDTTGAVTAVPFVRGIKGKGGYPADFDPKLHGLRRLGVETYRGVVFGTFSDAAEPLAAYLGDSLTRQLDRLFCKPVKVLGYMRQMINANWKLYYENVKDPYHAGLLHLFHATFGLYRPTQAGGLMMDKHKGSSVLFNIGGNYDRAEAEQQYRDKKKYVPEYDLADNSLLASRPDFPDGVANMIMTVFPSLVVQQIMNTMATRQIRPKGPSQFELYWTYFGFADDDEEMLDIRLKQANLVGPAGYISMEDSEAAELVQRGVAKDKEHCSVIEMGGRGPIEDVDYLISEIPIRGFWRRYAEVMDMPVAEPPR
ncbi:MAG: aromatic ring-hydroxylating dioxygenase subunit alpha, partial [Stellaceae bacterium]